MLKFRQVMLYSSGVALLLALPMLLGFTLPGEYARFIEAGNNLYSKAKFKNAEEKYDKAAQIDPERPEAMFNRGAARYRQGQFEQALSDCTTAARAAEGQTQQYAEYNAGNCAYRMQKPDEAIERYKRALTIDPNDQLAKHNLEMALRQKEQKKEQEKQDKDKKKDDKQNQDQKKDKQQSGQDDKQQQQQDQKQDKQDQQQDKQDQQKDKQDQADDQQGKDKQQDKQDKQDSSAAQQQAQQKDKEPLTPEQAAQLLSALAQEDAEMQKIIRRAPMTEERPTDKDW